MEPFLYPISSRNVLVPYKSPAAPVREVVLFVNADTYATQVILADQLTFFLYGSVSGVNLPPGYVLPVLWEKVDGPGPVVFDDPTIAQATCHFTVPGEYHLKISTFYGDIEAEDTAAITLVLNEAPVVFAGTAATVTLSDGTISFTPDSTLEDDELPAAANLTWSKISGPGEVTFADAHALQSGATFTEAGTYLLQLLADDGYLQGSSQITVTVLAPLALSFRVDTSAISEQWASSFNLPPGGRAARLYLWFITGSETRHLVATRDASNITPGDIVDFGAEVVSDLVVQGATGPFVFFVTSSTNIYSDGVEQTVEQSLKLTFGGANSGAFFGTLPTHDEGGGQFRPDFPTNQVSPATSMSWALTGDTLNAVELSDYTTASFRLNLTVPAPIDF